MTSCELEVFKNGAKHEIRWKGKPPLQTTKLGERHIAQLSVQVTGLDEQRCQHLGHCLHEALQCPTGLTEGDELWIKSDDVDVLCLPWLLLHDAAGYLASRGVTVRVSHLNAPAEPHLDRNLHIVLALGESHDDAELWREVVQRLPGVDTPTLNFATDSRQLLDALDGADIAVLPIYRDQLSQSDCASLPTPIGNVPWDELKRKVEDFTPRVLVLQIAAPIPLSLVRQAQTLSRHIPCVLIVPEAAAEPDSEPRPSVTFSLLQRSFAEQRALAAICSQAAAAAGERERGASMPRCFGGGQPPRPRMLPEWLIDDTWRIRLDRLSQSRIACGAVLELVRNPRSKTRGIMLVWHGALYSGLERFHERLSWELNQSGQEVCVCRPTWPKVTPAEDADFAGMYEAQLHAMPVDFNASPEALKRRFETAFVPLPSGGSQVLYLDHQVLPESFCREKNCGRVLRLYADWLRRVIIPAIPERLVPVFCLAMPRPLEQGDWESKVKAELTRQRSELLPLRVEVLTELPDVTEDDVLVFLQEHELGVPDGDRREGIVKALIARTGGRYEQTLRELEQLHLTWKFWWKRSQHLAPERKEP